MAVISFFSLHAAASWTLVGLKNEKINTVCHFAGSEENAVMVGTDKGIRWYEYGIWWENGGMASKPLGLPVYDIKWTSSMNLLAIAGNGSDSDGVYLGKVTAIGEPGTLFGFSLLVKWPKPTALALATLDGGCTDKVYVGNVNGVATGLLCNKAIDSLKTMTGPQHPFGITCAAMTFSPWDGMLYAGGNSYGIEFETGEYDTAMFLKGTTELTPVKKIDITSMTEFSSQNDTLLAIATLDSGIQVFKKGVLQYSLPSPVRNEPVVSIVPFATQNFGGGKWTMLVAATPSGVFRQCPPNADCIWSDFGVKIPASPRCLTQYAGRILWAGTDSGVYRYDYTTGVRQRSVATTPLSMHVSLLRGRQGSIGFDFDDIDRARYTLNVFDLRGRCVARDVIVGKQIVVTGVGRGMFLYRVMSDEGIAAFGSVMCY